MQQIIDLFQRLVNALEQIVISLNVVIENQGGTGPETQKQNALPAEKTDDMYPDENNRDAWLVACEARGIEVKKGVKTPTLIKQVKAFDAAAASAPKNTEAPQQDAPPTEDAPKTEKEDLFPGESTDTPAQDAVIEENDPFAAAGSVQKLTKELVLSRLQKVQQVKDTATVFNLLDRVAGVKLFNELPEDKYQLVFDCAETIIADNGAK